VNALWPHGDPRALAQAIVADPRFHGATSSAAAQPSIVDSILGWLGERIAELFRFIGHVLGTRSPLNVTIGVIVLAVAAAVLGYACVRFMRLPARRHRSAAARPVPLAGAASSAELLELARAAGRAERWHDAASALARAALRTLDERERLPFDPARTPGEARRLLRDPAFDAFEREATTALFAAHAATAERFARLRDTYARAFGDTV
jgi:hypothetical protein